MICEMGGNHRHVRYVVFVDGHFETALEETFQSDLLRRPENAAFAAALRKAEQP